MSTKRSIQDVIHVEDRDTKITKFKTSHLCALDLNTKMVTIGKYIPSELLSLFCRIHECQSPETVVWTYREKSKDKLEITCGEILYALQNGIGKFIQLGPMFSSDQSEITRMDTIVNKIEKFAQLRGRNARNIRKEMMSIQCEVLPPTNEVEKEFKYATHVMYGVVEFHIVVVFEDGDWDVFKVKCVNDAEINLIKSLCGLTTSSSVGDTKGFKVEHVLGWLSIWADENDFKDEIQNDLETGKLVWNPIFGDELKKRVKKNTHPDKCTCLLNNVIVLRNCEE